MSRRPGILFDVYMKKNWIGGVYYSRSIIYSCTLNKAITEKYELVVLVNEQTKELFDSLKDKVLLIEVDNSDKWMRLIEIFRIVRKYRIRWYYDLPQGKQGVPFKNIGIYWIPDFQHTRYSQFFEKDELEKRRQIFGNIARSNNWLILSSEDCYADFMREYPEHRCKVKVVHFVSYLENELVQLTGPMEEGVLQKYALNRKYIYIPNLFWQHKNHIVVFEAIRILAEKGELNEYEFVFTGELRDYRNTEYYLKLKAYMDMEQLKGRIRILGFIDRAEQLVVMKHAELLIQPSLFEGWGTVVEDAKVLDKTVILSDIPVHHEQKNDKCILFEAENPLDLLDKLKSALKNPSEESPERGLELTREKAYEYSRQLEAVFCER
ncbi:MAG: glycosyltransferase [Clostridium sp.]|nr:glycosyltransferase [Ruminococcus flavefaciens]MCM1500554.1 glycosyltransferase [Clostridium sp.]